MHSMLIYILAAVYLATAVMLACLNVTVLNKTPRPFGLRLLDLLLMPAYILGLLLACCILPLFWWLYPERHVHTLDVEGTEADMKAWAEHKAILACKPLWRRLAEKLRLATDTNPRFDLDG